eukprot:UN00627
MNGILDYREDHNLWYVWWEGGEVGEGTYEPVKDVPFYSYSAMVSICMIDLEIQFLFTSKNAKLTHCALKNAKLTQCVQKKFKLKFKCDARSEGVMVYHKRQKTFCIFLV